MSKAQQIAHQQNLTQRKYTNLQKIVLKAIRMGYVTIEQIVIATGVPKESVSGRLSELSDVGIIKEGKRARLTFYVEVKDPREIKQLQKERREEKRIKWIRRGERMGFIA